jgi:hypothetical protein
VRSFALATVAYFVLSISVADATTLDISDAFSASSNWTTFTTPGGTLGPTGALSVVQVPNLNGPGQTGTAAQFEVANGGGGIQQAVNLTSAGSISFTVNFASLATSPYTLTFTMMVDGVAYTGDSGHETYGSPSSPSFVSSEGLSSGWNLSAGEHTFGILITNNSAAGALGVNPYEYIGDFNINGPATQVSATPLPPSWTMTLIGLAGLGFIAYRRKNHSALDAA